MYHKLHNAPDFELVGFGDNDGLIIRIMGNETDYVAGALGQIKFLDCKLAVQEADGSTAVVGVDAAVDNQQIFRTDTGIDHTVANNLAVKCGSRMLNQFLVQIERSVHIILCRRRKSRPHASVGKRKRQVGRKIGCYKNNFVTHIG